MHPFRVPRVILTSFPTPLGLTQHFAFLVAAETQTLSPLKTSNSSSAQQRSVQTSFTGRIDKTFQNLSLKYELTSCLSTHALLLILAIKKKKKKKIQRCHSVVSAVSLHKENKIQMRNHICIWMVQNKIIICIRQCTSYCPFLLAVVVGKPSVTECFILHFSFRCHIN